MSVAADWLSLAVDPTARDDEMLPGAAFDSKVHPTALFLIAAPMSFGGRRRCILWNVSDPTDYIEEAGS